MKKFFNTKSQFICIILYALGLVLCFVVNTQTVTQLIVESVGGNSKDRWYSYMPRLVKTLVLDFSFIFVLVYSRLTFTKVRQYWHNNFQAIKKLFCDKSVFNKRNGIILVILFAISFIGFFALLRANVEYIDDIRHNVSTHYEWGNNKGRWGIVAANLLVQMGYTLGDRSPIPQLIAILALDVSALILAIVFKEVFKQEKIKVANLVASSIVIFNPCFLQCLSYKYESIGMGISVLLAIFPFLVVNNRKLFLWVSSISIFLMCAFYQSSSGIYILMVIFWGFLRYCLSPEVTIKDVILFYVESAIAFAIGTVVFYCLVLNLSFNDPSEELTSIAFGVNVVRNIYLYLDIFIQGFPLSWKILIVLLILCAVMVILFETKRNKLITLILFTAVLVISSIMSYGAYIFLETFGDRGRYIYGFVFMIAVLANITVMSKKVLLCIPAGVLAWSFFTYASAYGNALGFDRDYTNFMEKEVLSDINEYFPAEKYPELQVVFSGDTNNLLPVEYLIKEYPITEKMITGFLHYDGVPISSFWATRHFVYYDNTLSPAPTNYEPDPRDGELVVENRYYNLYLHGDNIIQVVFKKI